MTDLPDVGDRFERVPRVALDSLGARLRLVKRSRDGLRPVVGREGQVDVEALLDHNRSLNALVDHVDFFLGVVLDSVPAGRPAFQSDTPTAGVASPGGNSDHPPGHP